MVDKKRPRLSEVGELLHEAYVALPMTRANEDLTTALTAMVRRLKDAGVLDASGAAIDT